MSVIFFFFRISSPRIVKSVCWSHALVNGPTSKRPVSDGGRCSGQLLMMRSDVCSGSPHSHAALSASNYFFMDALYRPSSALLLLFLSCPIWYALPQLRYMCPSEMAKWFLHFNSLISNCCLASSLPSVLHVFLSSVPCIPVTRPLLAHLSSKFCPVNFPCTNIIQLWNFSNQNATSWHTLFLVSDRLFEHPTPHQAPKIKYLLAITLLPR